jgi:flagellar hook assembly protein FlgD
MSIKSIKAIVREQEYTLTLDADGYYSIEVPAGSDSSFPETGGYFPVSITATDDTDLSTTVDTSSAFGENLKLFVREVNKPTIEIITPADGGYITKEVTPEIKFEIVDNKTQSRGFSGINKESITLKIDGTAVSRTAISFEAITGGWRGTYTPTNALANGDHTITVDGTDNDGNSAVTATRTFEIDNQAPGLEIYSPTNGSATSNSAVTVTGKVADSNTPIVVNITLNNVDQGTVTVGSDGNFSKALNLTQQGDNVIKVTATDSVGNKSTEQTIVVKYNSTAPVFEDVEIIYNNIQVSASNKVPTSGSYRIRCKVSTTL